MVTTSVPNRSRSAFARREFLCVASEQHDLSAAYANLARDFKAKTARATGDERYFIAIELPGHSENVQRTTRLRKSSGAGDFDSRMLAIETCYFARCLAFHRALFQIGPFVARNFALSNAKLRL